LFRPPHGRWLDAVNPFHVGSVGLAGLSVLGGVILATAAGLAYLRSRGMPVLRTADVLAPSYALGEGITRIGCFLDGCCFGVACWGRGGVTLAGAAGRACLRSRGMPVRRTGEVRAPPCALGEGITRMGCFLNGCCFGVACELPWCMRSPAGSGAGQVFSGVA